MMDNDIYNQLKDIKLEELALIIFLISVFFDILGNQDIKRAYTGENGKEDARKKFILASCIAILVFGYFAYRNYKNLKKIVVTSQEYRYAYIRFIGSVFIVAGELLVLYYFINTSDLNDD